MYDVRDTIDCSGNYTYTFSMYDFGKKIIIPTLVHIRITDLLFYDEGYYISIMIL